MLYRAMLLLTLISVSACSNGGRSDSDAANDVASDTLANDVSTNDASTNDASTNDASTNDASANDATDVTPFDAPLADAASGDGGRLVSGFVIDAPRDAGPSPSGMNYTVDLATDGGPPGATLGSPCTTGSDCAALGAHAACLHSASGGFCTIDCDQDPEGPSQLCPAGSYCFAGLLGNGRVCLTTCSGDADCSSNGAATACSGSLFTFNVSPGLLHACLPPCANDADCNVDASGLLCDTAHHRCVLPREVVGAACSDNSDCLGLGPAGACMKNAQDPSRSYCTIACDPAATDPCRLGGFNAGATVGPCVPGYAMDPAGADVPVCLGGCSSEAECQRASSNTCNYVPSYGASVCTIACRRDADCVDGTCNTATGDCQQPYFSTHCGSDSDCTGGLCVADFHHGGQHNCSLRCAMDGDCPAGSVCVTSPVALDAAGESLAPEGGASSVGFCAPSCTLDAGACADPSTHCLPPADPPEVDFAGSGSASSAFCWR